MNGPTAQLVALACYFNGHARGVAKEPFPLTHATAKFCEYIRFWQLKQSWLNWKAEPVMVAGSPDEWLAGEARAGRRAYVQFVSGDPKTTGAQMAGFVGGGVRWQLVVAEGATADIYVARWQVGNRQAADRRIWQVDYRLEEPATLLPALDMQTCDTVITRFRRVLEEALRFCRDHDVLQMSGYFEQADRCLTEAEPKQPYYKDLAPGDLLSLSAQRLLAAGQAAWVFGGAGSWNDMGFSGEAGVQYDRLTEDLYEIINTATATAANSTAGTLPA